MAKLDTNAAWKEATALVAANRDVLFALAGVFFLLPSLALAIFGGEPQVASGMGQDEMVAAMAEFYGRAWWLILISAVLQVVGMLAILTLMRDRTRPTVGEAIAGGFSGAVVYLVAQFVFFFAAVLVGSLAIGAAAVVSPVLAGVLVVVLFGALVFAFVRLVLLAPLVAVEGMRNPFAALRRSWALTRGNFWRIFGFLVLVGILFLVVLAIVMLIVGVILAIAASGETPRVIAAVFSSALGAVAVVYFVAIVAAIHRQLAGPASGELAATFE